MDFLALSNLDTVTRPPSGNENTTTSTTTPDAGVNQTAAPISPMMSIVSLVLYIGFFGVMIWLLIIRPNKKREKSHAQLVEKIRTGDSIVTNTGFYGKVVDVTEGCFIIEFGTNKGIRIPVEKSEIAGIKEPNLTTKRYDAIETTENDKK